jgi:ABC-2 type transport system ATP-binding protein
MIPVIVLNHLTVRFRRLVAVDDLSIEIPQGKIYGFLGENGAGKTTTIRAMMGLQRPSSGTVRVLEEDPLGGNAELLQRIGYVSDDRAMYRWMRVTEIIRFNAGLYRQWDSAYAETLREEFELDPWQKIKTLSRGQIAKLALLTALAPLPELLILDEASSGLDPIVRRTILEKLIDVTSQRGTTVFLSSHLLEEVDRIADIVAILCRGKLLAEGDKDTVRKSLKRLICPGAVPTPPQTDSVLSIKESKEETQLIVRDLDDTKLQQLTQTLGVAPKVFDMTLEDVFAEYTAWGKKS